MAPNPHALQTIIERIRETSPEARLIALLRDPLERCISQARRMKKVSRGPEESIDEFVGRLAAKRGGLDKVPLVLASDYGRILRRYYETFPEDQIRVFFTADLDRDPATVYRQVFEHIGVHLEHDPGQPRVHLGGISQRVSQEALQELQAEMDRRGLLPTDENERRGFVWWLRHLWNTEPDQRGTEISDALRRWLAERYVADAKVLEGLIGVEPPWLDSLRAAI